MAEIARALAAVAGGASYRQAAIQASVLRPAGLNGQLVANWVKVFGPIVTGPAMPRACPPLLQVGALRLRQRHGADGPVVLLAVGMVPGGPPQLCQGYAVPRVDEAVWLAFFEELKEAPQVLIVEQCDSCVAAASRRWGPSPPRLVGLPQPPRNTSTPRHRRSAGPTLGERRPSDSDVRAVAASFSAVRQALFHQIASRQTRFSNQSQLDQLVRLMMLHLSGEADPATFADRITADLSRAGMALVPS